MNSQKKIKAVVYTAFFTALIAVCSWIALPMPNGVPVTLQTFAVFCAAALLPPKCALTAIAIYVTLGAVGLPVFSGGGGGLGKLLGPTGGYIIGFLVAAPICAVLVKRFGKGMGTLVFAMVIGQILCYIFGSAWFFVVYTKNTGSIPFWRVVSLTILPYLLPDILKITLAASVVMMLKKTSISRQF